MARTLQNHVSTVRLVVGVLTFVVAPVVMAESGPADYQYSSPTFHQPVAPFPVEMGFSQHHSSTAAEGFLRGKAAVIQAMGNFRLADGQAAILFEQARALDRDNNLLQTKALHAQQIMWREKREADRAAREARLAEGRLKVEERRATVHRAAYQLSPVDLNVATGEIHWPAALQSDRFRPERERMQDLFRQLASYGDAEPSVVAEIARSSEAFARVLRTEIRTLDRDEYMAAQKFLLGLKFAAKDSVQG